MLRVRCTYIQNKEVGRLSEETAPYEIQDTDTASVMYAGFWMRFWAYLADLIIVLLLSGIITSFIRVFAAEGDIVIGYWTLSGIVGTVIFYLYFLFMTKYFSQTRGKMIFGLKVIRRDGESVNWTDLIFREIIGRFLHRVFWFANVLYIAVAITPQKQGIHDMLGDTRVILTRR